MAEIVGQPECLSSVIEMAISLALIRHAVVISPHIATPDALDVHVELLPAAGSLGYT